MKTTFMFARFLIGIASFGLTAPCDLLADESSSIKRNTFDSTRLSSEESGYLIEFQSVLKDVISHSYYLANSAIILRRVEGRESPRDAVERARHLQRIASERVTSLEQLRSLRSSVSTHSELVKMLNQTVPPSDLSQLHQQLIKVIDLAHKLADTDDPTSRAGKILLREIIILDDIENDLSERVVKRAPIDLPVQWTMEVKPISFLGVDISNGELKPQIPIAPGVVVKPKGQVTPDRLVLINEKSESRKYRFFNLKGKPFRFEQGPNPGFVMETKDKTIELRIK